jgi:hypothetical protein
MKTLMYEEAHLWDCQPVEHVKDSIFSGSDIQPETVALGIEILSTQ